MDGFVGLCSDAGGNPPGVVFDRMRKRRRVLSAMMRNRSSVRYLVAPHGYGKSVVAYDYAASICSLERSWWVDAGDSRFLRDLDAGRVPSALLAEAGRSACLVVFDDLPFLDSERAERFSKACAELVERGWEVVATALPSCDRSRAIGCDLTLIGPAELALDEDEACDASPPGTAVRTGRARTVPALAWGSPAARRRFVSKVVSEALPRDLSLAIMALLLLQKGSLTSAVALCGFPSETVFLDLAPVHTYLGIEARSGRFEACELDPEELSDAFLSKLPDVVPDGPFGMDSWAAKVADLLLADRRAERACDVVRAMCSSSARASWLSERQRSLALSGCFLPARRLEESLESACCDLLAWGAWAKAVLGDEGAFAEAKRAVKDPGTSECGRMLACLLLFDAPSPADSKKAGDLLARLLPCGKSLPKEQFLECEDACRRALSRAEEDPGDGDGLALAKASWLSAVCCDLRKGSARSLSRARAQVERALSDDGARFGDVAAAMLHAVLRSLERLKAVGPLTEQARRVESSLPGLVAETVLAADRCGRRVGYLEASLVRDSGVPLESLAERGASQRVLAEIAGIVEDVGRQRAAWRRSSGAGEGAPSILPAAAPAFSRASFDVVPELRADLLGGVAVRLGSRKVDSKALRRQSVRTLLALLVLARGRELSVERVERALWPDSTPERARNNFYSTWSHLRRALTLDSGACPYLARLQHSCRLEASFASSDVIELESICAGIGEGRFDAASVPGLVRRAESLYRGELLPGESRNPVIVRHRAEIRARYVDALVLLSGRMLAEREPALALGIARKAVMHGSSREDVYEALMRAQAAMGQRTSAMASFMECRKMLNDDLGIDPSARLASLYERLLGEDDPGTGQMRLPI